ncbi:uncharacterized protein J4E78_000482 [Alternaria triticimaculans]|uniref:uncharacterized protein n=1 Tax=Alternaria triticimaculans TaxID=297637 RepID=UPI0020C37383|nr:uncharacterized protein J4E78_000482 [Alternaria triticimaculans]KAI4671983.1 hypothetical protein J4E78_000482 [Alternaria triticimaculans]
MGQRFSQFFPPAPAFTETSLPNLSGKVYIVTGASAGIGKELSRLLYTHHATVYIAARSAEKAHAAISYIKEACPDSKGTLHYLHLDLDDLSGIKASAESFLAKESRLDVLFNNAGVMVPPVGSTTKQGYELQLGTNCVAPFLFTKLLTPILLETVKKEAKGSVRVIWALNPGNLKTELGRNMNAVHHFFANFMLYPTVNGAYTELFAGLAPGAAKLKTGEWVMPFGRVGTLRKDYWSETGKKTASAFWEWSEKQVEQYA